MDLAIGCSDFEEAIPKLISFFLLLSALRCLPPLELQLPVARDPEVGDTYLISQGSLEDYVKASFPIRFALQVALATSESEVFDSHVLAEFEERLLASWRRWTEVLRITRNLGKGEEENDWLLL